MSGPSGAGKGTVVRRLLQLRPDVSLSVSATTRAPRAGEVDGRDYRFVSNEEFDRLVADGAFLEWASIYGHRSGTLLAPILERLGAGHDVILEIDVQGAATVRDRVPEAILIFLEAPSEEELIRRLRRRGTENEEELARRVAASREEMAAAGWFDHRVVNDDPDRAAAQVAAILDATRESG